MLFMAITTWNPGKTDAIVKRFAEKGSLATGKVIGQWNTMTGSRTYRVVEYDDPKVMVAGGAAWSDLGEIEYIPIISSEEGVKAYIASKK